MNVTTERERARKLLTKLVVDCGVQFPVANWPKGQDPVENAIIESLEASRLEERRRWEGPHAIAAGRADAVKDAVAMRSWFMTEEPKRAEFEELAREIYVAMWSGDLWKEAGQESTLAKILAKVLPPILKAARLEERKRIANLKSISHYCRDAILAALEKGDSK